MARMETGNGRSLELTLPFSPSVNSLYRTFKGRMILSKRGRQFRVDSLAMILTQERHKFTGRVAVEYKLYPPDKRRRDLDNCIKALHDTLTHAGIWNDDEQVDDLRVIRCECVPGGKVIVQIREL
jgi:crossover junction endodeoxyribonuclease RusA